MTNRLEPAHIIMLRGALATSYYGTYHEHRLQSDVDTSARHLSHWTRITRSAREFANLTQLPLGLVLLALEKGV